MKLWGLRPFGFHLTNLLALDAAVVLTVLALARRVTGGELAAVIAALIFALHPLHSESVSFVSGRTDVVATLFFLLAVLAYDRGRDARGGVAAAGSPGAYLLALLAEEVAITLPLILALWDWRVRGDLRDRRAAWRAAARYAPYAKFGALALYLGLRGLALRGAAGDAAGAWAPPLTRLLTTLQATASYAWMTVAPVTAGDPLPARRAGHGSARPVLVARHGGPGRRARRDGVALARRPVVGFGALWFWITRAPSVGVNLLPLPTVLMAERFLYTRRRWATPWSSAGSPRARSAR